MIENICINVGLDTNELLQTASRDIEYIIKTKSFNEESERYKYMSSKINKIMSNTLTNIFLSEVSLEGLHILSKCLITHKIYIQSYYNKYLTIEQLKEINNINVTDLSKFISDLIENISNNCATHHITYHDVLLRGIFNVALIKSDHKLIDINENENNIFANRIQVFEINSSFVIIHLKLRLLLIDNYYKSLMQSEFDYIINTIVDKINMPIVIVGDFNTFTINGNYNITSESQYGGNGMNIYYQKSFKNINANIVINKDMKYNHHHSISFVTFGETKFNNKYSSRITNKTKLTKTYNQYLALLDIFDIDDKPFEDDIESSSENTDVNTNKKKNKKNNKKNNKNIDKRNDSDLDKAYSKYTRSVMKDVMKAFKNICDQLNELPCNKYREAGMFHLIMYEILLQFHRDTPQEINKINYDYASLYCEYMLDLYFKYYFVYRITSQNDFVLLVSNFLIMNLINKQTNKKDRGNLQHLFTYLSNYTGKTQYDSKINRPKCHTTSKYLVDFSMTLNALTILLYVGDIELLDMFNMVELTYYTKFHILETEYYQDKYIFNNRHYVSTYFRTLCNLYSSIYNMLLRQDLCSSINIDINNIQDELYKICTSLLKQRFNKNLIDDTKYICGLSMSINTQIRSQYVQLFFNQKEIIESDVEMYNLIEFDDMNHEEAISLLKQDKLKYHPTYKLVAVNKSMSELLNIMRKIYDPLSTKKYIQKSYNDKCYYDNLINRKHNFSDNNDINNSLSYTLNHVYNMHMIQLSNHVYMKYVLHPDVNMEKYFSERNTFLFVKKIHENKNRIEVTDYKIKKMRIPIDKLGFNFSNQININDYSVVHVYNKNNFYYKDFVIFEFYITKSHLVSKHFNKDDYYIARPKICVRFHTSEIIIDVKLDNLMEDLIKYLNEFANNNNVSQNIINTCIEIINSINECDIKIYNNHDDIFKKNISGKMISVNILKMIVMHFIEHKPIKDDDYIYRSLFTDSDKLHKVINMCKEIMYVSEIY